MKLVINNEPVEIIGQQVGASLASLIDQLMDAEKISESDVVSSIEIDDRNVDPLDKGMMKVHLDPKKIKVISIKTESVQQLLLTAIQDGRDSCLAIESDCKMAAEKFRQDKVADANDYYSLLSSRIITVLEYLSDLNQYIRSASKDADLERFDRIRNHFQSILKEAISYQEDADWVMLADLLEYEFTDIFSEFADYLETTCHIT